MRVADPSRIFSISAGMNSSAEGVATFATDDFAGKGIAFLIFIIATLDAFFIGSLLYESSSCIEIFVTDDCFMMVCHIILVELSVIPMPVEIAVRIGLLENAIASVFLICENAANTGRSPVATFLGGNALGVQAFSNGIRSFTRKKLRKDTFHNYCLFRVDNDFSILPAIPIRYIP